MQTSASAETSSKRRHLIEREELDLVERNKDLCLQATVQRRGFLRTHLDDEMGAACNTNGDDNKATKRRQLETPKRRGNLEDSDTDGITIRFENCHQNPPKAVMTK